MSCGWQQCGRSCMRTSDAAGGVAGDDGCTWWSLGQCLLVKELCYVVFGLSILSFSCCSLVIRTFI